MSISGFILVHIRSPRGLLARYVNVQHITMIHPPDTYNCVRIQIGKKVLEIEESLSELHALINQCVI